VDFFVYNLDAPGTEALRDDDQLLEAHWSYMDRFANSMIARGPTLTPDRESTTGSLHVLGLPSLAAAREFVEREPNNRAGVYAEHWIWTFENLLGRTMWEFSGDADEPRFLVIARADGDQRTPVSVRPAPPAELGAELRNRLIIYGTLATPESGEMIGVSVALHAPDKEAAVALLGDGVTGLDALPIVVAHDWEFGGRR
jgi:uncharacterized protein